MNLPGILSRYALLWYIMSCMMTLVSSQKFFRLITLMMLAASSASGSSLNLLARTRQAAAWKKTISVFTEKPVLQPPTPPPPPEKKDFSFYFVINHGWFFVNFVTVQGFFEMNQPLQNENKNMWKTLFHSINLYFKLVSFSYKLILI